ncbi:MULTISPECIES: winged helix-turn-helix transcriptional regulator [Brevibacterium]|uniref:Transcriptional regulatory protein, C terminal n=1 Tax=Brevibacterium antiquum CNRZ 918 TaxID=1255637 RepID=A0A2H1IVN3_9MICO|nr:MULTISPECIES: winged helix-turn-helix transcriptional regulator [Brevibacterium]SMX79218.1 Transcriptional regulatory protein, C terminal [Brevibacterium antiquum CNRZ 918]HCG57220.1 winged helix family transcriptional regulator [Brevibacterium sp.]
MSNSEPAYAHPRSAAAIRRAGARLSAVDPQNPPHTFGPAGVVPSPKAARGIIVYIGLDESKAAADGTNLSAIAGELQAYAKELASQAETQAVIALAPEGRGNDIDAVRAVANGSPAATGTPAGTHGPVRSRIPSRIHPPPLRRESEQGIGEAAPTGGFGSRFNGNFQNRAAERLRIDIPRREVRIDGDLIDVTTKEFDLLATLVSHADSTLPREDLIAAVWSGGEVPDERTVDVHIRRLRRRLGEYSTVIRTMRGTGYRYDTHPDVTVWSATAHR